MKVDVQAVQAQGDPSVIGRGNQQCSLPDFPIPRELLKKDQ